MICNKTGFYFDQVFNFINNMKIYFVLILHYFNFQLSLDLAPQTVNEVFN